MRVVSGVPGFDELLHEGLPRGTAIALQSPPGRERDAFLVQFVAEGLRNGGAALVVLSSLPPEAFRDALRTLGVNVDAATAENRLWFVDWHSHAKRPVQEVEQDGSVFRASIDLANVGVAISRAIAVLPLDREPRAAIEVLSPALHAYDLQKVRGFAQTTKAKLERFGFTSVFALETGRHDEQTLSSLREPFDGTVDIRRTQESDTPGWKIAILSLKGTTVEPTHLPLGFGADHVLRAGAALSSGAPWVVDGRIGANVVAAAPRGDETQSGGGGPSSLQPQTKKPDRFARLLAFAEQRLQKNSRDADALFVRAAGLAAAKDLRWALETLNTLANVDEGYPGLWIFKAKLHKALGEPEAEAASRARGQEMERRREEAMLDSALVPPLPEPSHGCASCGLAVLEQDTVCPWCGAALERATKPPATSVERAERVTDAGRRLDPGPKGLTNGLARGTPRGSGRTNGLASGMTNGLARGLHSLRTGMTNGLTNGSGFTNGLGSVRLRHEVRTTRWKVYVVPLVTSALILLPLFGPVGPEASRPIVIDGDFADWDPRALASASLTASLNPNVDLIRFAASDNGNYLAFAAEVRGTALKGGGTSPTTDRFVVFFDTDRNPSTGYRVDGWGADRMIEVMGWDGFVNHTALYEWDENRDATDWRGWIGATPVPAAASGPRLEVEVDWLTLMPARGSLIALLQTQGHDGSADVADFALNPAGGSLIVHDEPMVPDILVSSPVSLLRITAKAFGEDVQVTSVGVALTGSAPTAALTNLQLLDGNGAVVAEATVNRHADFVFAPMVVPSGDTAEFTVVAETTAANTDTLGARIESPTDIVAGSAAVTIRHTPGPRDVGYLGTIPTAPRIDGGLAEWAAVSTDPFGDATAADANIDLEAFGAQSGTDGSYFHARVAGTMFAGTWIPEGTAPAPPATVPPPDQDRDTVPDAVDPFPWDFNNDRVADAASAGDVDDDGVLDYGQVGGTDRWLNTTIPGTFPVPYAGNDVRVYVGPVERPYRARDDTMRIFVDLDNSSGTGYAIANLGADRLVEIAGMEGLVRTTGVYAFGGSYPGQWAWQRTSNVSYAIGLDQIEFRTMENLTMSGSRLFVEMGNGLLARDSMDMGTRGTRGDTSTSSFEAFPAPILTPWHTKHPPSTRASTLIDGSSNSITTQYNHQRKVVRAGDAPGDGPCDPTNSDGCWYAVFSDQSVETTATTAASAETMTTGTKVSGSFPTDIMTENDVTLQYREQADEIGVVGYRSSTANGVSFPKQLDWTGVAWGAELELTPTAGAAVENVKVLWDPTIGSPLFWVFVNTGANIHGYRCTNADSCTKEDLDPATANTYQTTQAVGTAPERHWDAEVEDSSGEILLVYDNEASESSTNDFCYVTRAPGIWGAWGVETCVDHSSIGVAESLAYVTVANNPGTNLIGLGLYDRTNDDFLLAVWDGTAWVHANKACTADVTTNVVTSTWGGTILAEDGANEFVAWCGNGADNVAECEWSSAGGWEATCETFNYDQGEVGDDWKAGFTRPLAGTNEGMTCATNDLDDQYCYVWNGVAGVDAGAARVPLGFSNTAGCGATTVCLNIGFDWNATQSGTRDGLFTFYENVVGQLGWATFNDASDTVTFGSPFTSAGSHLWVSNYATRQVGNTEKVHILASNSNFDVLAYQWDGNAIAPDEQQTVTADTVDETYPYFSMAFQTRARDLEVRYDWTSVPGGSSYTLRVKGYRQDENVLVEVLTPPSTWNARITISATTNTLYTYTLTMAEYNSGSPSIRFVDATPSDSALSDLWVDGAAVVTNDARVEWDRIVLMRSSNPAGSAWGSPIILASGRPTDGPLLQTRDSAEPSIAIDSAGYLHIVWVSASAPGDQSTLDRVRYTRSTVAFPTQSELGVTGNWEPVTSTDDSYNTKVGAFNIGTGGAGTTVPVIVGFQPKAVLFWWSGRTTSTDSAGTADHQRGFGVAVTTSDRRSTCSQSQDNQPAAVGDKGHHDAAAICSLTTAGAFDGLADLSSMNADGFTVVIDDPFATNLRIHYLALGGSSLTDAKTGMFIESASLGNQDITTVGFQPDAVILFSSRSTFDPPGADVDSSLMVGFAAGPGNPNDVVLFGGSNDASDPTQTVTYHRAGESIAVAESAVTVLSARGEVDAWLANGFSLNWNEVIGVRRFHYLALKGGNYVVGDLTTSTTPGATVAESGFGFSPQASLFLSHHKAQSTVDTLQAHDELSIGAFSSTADRGVQCGIDEDGVVDSDVGTAVEHDEVYCNLDANTAIEGLMGLQSVGSDGFTLVMDDPDPAASFVGYMSFGGDVSYPGSMPTVSTDMSNYPHLAWSGSKASGIGYYRNKAGGAWRPTVSWGTTHTGLSVDVSPQNNYVNLVRGGGPWYDTAWQFRKTITVDSAKMGATLTNFPLLISRTDADLQSKAQADGDDILFTASDGITKLSHEIERYTSGTGELIAWVNVPTLSSAVDTEILMYYGNAGAANQQDPFNAADGNTVSVWHLREDPAGPAPQMKDSVSTANHGTTSGMSSADRVAGKIGYASNFVEGGGGSGDLINMGDKASLELPIYTWSMWIKGSAPPTCLPATANEQPMVNGDTQFQFNWDRNSGGVGCMFMQGAAHQDSTSWLSAKIVSPMTGGVWYHVAGTYDGASLRVYLNGTLEAATTSGPPIPTAGCPSSVCDFYLGGSVGATPWTGQLDEVRVSNVPRPALWLITEYQNQNAPSTFYSVGAEEGILQVHYAVCKNLSASNCDDPTEFTRADGTAGHDAVATAVATAVPTGSAFLDGGSVAIGTSETTLATLSTTLPSADNYVAVTVAVSTALQGTSGNVDIAAGNLRLKRGAATLATNEFLCRAGGTVPSNTVYPTNYCYLLYRDPGAPANPSYDVTALASATGMNGEAKVVVMQGVTATFQDGVSVPIGTAETTLLSHGTSLGAGNNLVIAAFQIDNTGANNFLDTGNVRIKRGAAVLASNEFQLDIQSSTSSRRSTGYLLLARDVGAPASPTYTMTSLAAAAGMNGEVKVIVVQETGTVRHAIQDGGSVAVQTAETVLASASTAFPPGENVVFASHHYRNEGGGLRNTVAGNDRIRENGVPRSSNQFDIRLSDWATSNGGIGNPGLIWRQVGADSSPSYDSTAFANAGGMNGEAKIAVIHLRDSDVSFPSLATSWNVNGDLWVSYAKDIDATTRAIYARFLDYPGATWASAETVDSLGGTRFARPSIGIDKDNNVHALYVATANPQVYYNKRTGVSWGTRTPVEHPSSDNPTLVVRAPNDATYGTDAGGLYWKTSTSETYFYLVTGIPEFEALAVPVSILVLLAFFRRRRGAPFRVSRKATARPPRGIG